MIVKGAFVPLTYTQINLAFIRAYWEEDPSGYWEAEAMGLGYQGA